MRFVIQVASDARVTVDQKVIGSLSKGFVVFIGVEDADNTETVDKMLRKMLSLRIFPDENGKTNQNLAQVDGGVLLISQFTLYADCRHGNRPSFTRAGAPDHAKKLYEYLIEKCLETGVKTQIGEFGADMRVTFTNEGPFTVILDSAELM